MPSVSSVTFGNVTLVSDGSSRWKLQGISGWYDGPAPRVNLIDRPTNDGYFNPGTVYRSGRAITITGFVVSPDPATAFTSDWPALSSIATTGGSLTLSVTDPAGTMTSMVWLAAAPELRQITDTHIQFQIQFVAPDPLKYGTPTPYSATLPTQGGGLEYNLGSPSGALYYGANGYLGRIVITNTGTAQAYPSLQVVGGLPQGFFLNVLETNEKLSYPRALMSTDTVYMNMRTGRATINGESDVTAYFDLADFFGVPAGTTRTVQFNSYGGSPVGTPTLSGNFSPGNW